MERVASLVIFSDSTQLGVWHDLPFLEALSAKHKHELLILCCGDLMVRRLGEGLQVFCQRGTNIAAISISISQILADIILRERIADRSVVQMNDLVEGVLCPILKS